MPRSVSGTPRGVSSFAEAAGADCDDGGALSNASVGGGKPTGASSSATGVVGAVGGGGGAAQASALPGSPVVVGAADTRDAAGGPDESDEFPRGLLRSCIGEDGASGAESAAVGSGASIKDAGREILTAESVAEEAVVGAGVSGGGASTQVGLTSASTMDVAGGRSEGLEGRRKVGSAAVSVAVVSAGWEGEIVGGEVQAVWLGSAHG